MDKFILKSRRVWAALLLSPALVTALLQVFGVEATAEQVLPLVTDVQANAAAALGAVAALASLLRPDNADLRVKP